jgi:hypothetical protein
VFRSLAACHSRLAALGTEVGRLAAAVAIPDSPVEPAEGLEEVGARLAAVTHAEARRARALALSILERVLRLQSRDDGDRPALEQAQSSARELHQIITTSTPPETPPVVEQLAQGAHPFACLLNLVDGAAAATARADLCGSVAWAFGPALAESADRARLFLAPEPAAPPATNATERHDG